MDTQQIQEIILLSLIAGAAIPVGGFLGAISEIYPRWLNEEWRHSIIAFGGGALLSAISLVLVPEGIRHISVIAACMAFIGGGILFCIIDYKLSEKKGSTAQLMAMLLDFVPEAVALGAALVDGSGTGMLLVFLIAIQNLPEGFNAFREIQKNSSIRKVKLLLAFTALALLGPLSAFFGATVLADQKAVLGVLMVFSSGGILFLTFQDIAPQARLEKHWVPTLGAVLGFALGLIGHMLSA